MQSNPLFCAVLTFRLLQSSSSLAAFMLCKRSFSTIICSISVSAFVGALCSEQLESTEYFKKLSPKSTLSSPVEKSIYSEVQRRS